MLLAWARNWWVLLLRGIFAILFGILAFAWPGGTLLALVIIFGAYALLDGITAIVLGFAARDEHNSLWAMLLAGLLGILAGIVAFVWPGITAVALLIVVATWAIVRGVLEIIAAIRLRKVIAHEWLLALAGALSILFGVLLLVWPGAGLLTLVWLIGIFAILFGIVAIALSLRMRNLKHWLELRGDLPPMAGLA